MTRRSAPLCSPRLSLVPALLALAACGDGADEADGGAPSFPLGFELALVGSAEAATGKDDSATAAPAIVDLTPEQLAARIALGNVRVIDVRTEAEVAEGVIPGAEHIPLDRFDPDALDLSDGRDVVLYCRSGRRSALAGEKLSEATGKPAEHLAGGILAWEAAGQAVEIPPK